MASSSLSLGLPPRIEDVLEHLPISGITEYAKGRMIYGPDDISKSIYLVVTGKVGISRLGTDGSEVLLEIVPPDELFGESAFVGIPRCTERATAIEKVTLMAWVISEMEDLVMKRPRLALALVQILAQRNAEFTRRIESLSVDTVERRLARSLIHFSERLGTPEEDGSVGMMPFTHEMLARYVGTSREIITTYMNQFRKQGYVSYSRRGVLLYRDGLKMLLDRTGCQPADRSS